MALLAGVAACSAPGRDLTDREARTTKTAQAIIAGTPSANESVIQLASREVDGSDVYYKGCSGSLVAKNLVMTARHCVSEFDPATGEVTRNSEASLSYVFAGKDAPAHLTDGTAPAARGTELVLPPGKSLLPDIAFIVLDRDVTTATVAKIRLATPAVKGEDLTLVGFGRTETGDFAMERRERKGVTILGVGPFEGVFHNAGAEEFMIGEGACFGDSGGAAFSTKTGAVVGVTSRVQNGKDETVEDPIAPCVGPGAEDIYTTVSAMKPLVEAAFAAAGAKPLVESGLTPESTGGTLETETPSAKPPAPRLPPTVGEDPDAQDPAGCSATRRSPHDAGMTGLALAVGAVLLGRRRRRV